MLLLLVLLLVLLLSLALSSVEAQQPMAHSSLSPPTAYHSQQPMGYAGIVPSAGPRPVGTTNLPAAWTTAAHGGDDPLRRGREGPGPGAGIPPAMPTSTNLNYQGHDQAGWNNPGELSSSRDREIGRVVGVGGKKEEGCWWCHPVQRLWWWDGCR